MSFVLFPNTRRQTAPACIRLRQDVGGLLRGGGTPRAAPSLVLTASPLSFKCLAVLTNTELCVKGRGGCLGVFCLSNNKLFFQFIEFSEEQDGGEEDPLGVHEEVQRSQMGHVH